ncbi:Protein bem46 [Ceratocystis fimbriata CBS 114723]|uniref:Protein bem46 n=2 Tax=Ceratocystis TaxID=5157 RepID=A0A0F8B1K0_CERFI|nr:Protein bem46 [Ceratocystis platani]PHH53358.1 Protein bem46 [Ceratocystis fimbriata CBS 114723]
MSSSSPTVTDQTVSFARSVASYLRLPALASTGVAAVFTGLLYFKQKAFIYPSHMPPNARTDVPRPSQFGIKDFEELVIPTNDGEKLSAFFIRAPKNARNSQCTVIMFHGNAGNIGHRLPIARMLINYVGCNVFMLEYRGYGLSTGEPDEAGLNVDAQTALDYLRDRHETSTHRFIIYGQSLGGAVSVKLAAQNQNVGDIAGLILENTFLSMRKLIPSVIPMAKYISVLCHQVWPSDTLIPNITIPILFLSGEQDEIVPPVHMRKLHELARTRKRVWKSFPGGDHNSSVLEEGYFESISTFVNEISDDLPIQGTDEEDKNDFRDE